MTNKPISEVIAEIKAASELIERGYRQTWGCEDSDDGIYVGTFYEDGDLCPFIETSISNWSGDEKDNENLAAFLVAANPVSVKRLIDHIAALEQQLAAERARVKWPIPWPIPARFDYQSDEEYAGAVAMLRECKNSVAAAGIPVEGE